MPATFRPDAVIFDMDGLLLDSEAVMRRCFETVAAEMEIVLPTGAYEGLIGLNAAASETIMAAYVPADPGVAVFSDAYHALYDEEMHREVPLKAGALELARHLDDTVMPRAVATSTDEPRARRKLKSAGLLAFMQALAFGNEVANGKPAPDIFLLAAARLGVAPERCVAFEDSRAGVRSALAAGMQVVQVPDLVPPEAGIEREGVIIADNLLSGARQVGLLAD